MQITVKAILGMSSLNPDGRVTKGQFITDCVTTASNYFDPASMPVSLANMGLCVTNLHDAIILAAAGAPGTVSDMHAKSRMALTMFTWCVPMWKTRLTTLPTLKRLLKRQV